MEDEGIPDTIEGKRLEADALRKQALRLNARAYALEVQASEQEREGLEILAQRNGHDCPACGFHLPDEDMDVHIRMWHSAQ